MVTIDGQEDEEVERMKGVVASHLDRFAFREAPLKFDVVPAEAPLKDAGCNRTGDEPQ